MSRLTWIVCVADEDWLDRDRAPSGGLAVSDENIILHTADSKNVD